MNGLRPILLLLTVIAVVLMMRADVVSADTIVILVRHAEKQEGRDPSLTDLGYVRANALIAVLKDAGIDHIVTTQYKRTQQTAAPVAKAFDLTPEVVQTSQGLEDHVAAVAKAVQACSDGEVVLVVGHSNTVPAIIHKLGGPKLPDLDEATEYSTLFMLVMSDTEDPRLVRSTFGPPNRTAPDQD